MDVRLGYLQRTEFYQGKWVAAYITPQGTHILARGGTRAEMIEELLNQHVLIPGGDVTIDYIPVVIGAPKARTASTRVAEPCAGCPKAPGD